MISILRRKPRSGTRFALTAARRPGARYDGPSAYIDPSEAARLGCAPGHYAIEAGLPRFRLVAVDDAPGDPDDGAWHLEVAGKGDPIARAGRLVELEAQASSRSGVQA